MRRLNWLLRAGTALVAALALGAACSPGGDPTDAASGSTSSTAPTAAAPGPPGRFFALGGKNLFDAGLYELVFGPPRLRRLSPTGRVSSLGACPTMLVVAAAQREVGFSDHLQRFQRGRFGPVEGLGAPAGFSPEAAPDCRILYSDVDRSSADLIDRLHVWDPVTGTDTIVHTSVDLAGHAWGPNGRIAVVETTRGGNGQEPTATGILLIEPDGSRRTLPAPAPRLSDFEWSTTGWLAVGQDTVGTIFLQPDTGERRELAGWEPQAWSPDGEQLLVTKSQHQRRLGLVKLADLGTVTPLGDTDAPVYDAVWLPAGADPLG